MKVSDFKDPFEGYAPDIAPDEPVDLEIPPYIREVPPVGEIVSPPAPIVATNRRKNQT